MSGNMGISRSLMQAWSSRKVLAALQGFTLHCPAASMVCPDRSCRSPAALKDPTVYRLLLVLMAPVLLLHWILGCFQGVWISAGAVVPPGFLRGPMDINCDNRLLQSPCIVHVRSFISFQTQNATSSHENPTALPHSQTPITID